MIPILFEIGPIKIYSYGLMLGIGFLLGGYVLSIEFRRKKIDPDLASAITIFAVIFGIAGAKLLFLIENWDAFLRHPFSMALSAGGLTWYGGFIVAMVAVFLHVRAKKVPFLKVWDALALALMIGYGVGRLGCHFSGDGDYGVPTQLPWGTIYAQGTAKPTNALEEYFLARPEEAKFWHYDSLRVIPVGRDRIGYPITRFDELTPLHPVPVYELILSIVGFAILWKLRTRTFPDGKLFMIYLMMASVFRFGIEFVRLNPRILCGLSEAQLISVVIFLIGLLSLAHIDRRARQPSAEAAS